MVTKISLLYILTPVQDICTKHASQVMCLLIVTLLIKIAIHSFIKECNRYTGGMSFLQTQCVTSFISIKLLSTHLEKYTVADSAIGVGG